MNEIKKLKIILFLILCALIIGISIISLLSQRQETYKSEEYPEPSDNTYIVKEDSYKYSLIINENELLENAISAEILKRIKTGLLRYQELNGMIEISEWEYIKDTLSKTDDTISLKIYACNFPLTRLDLSYDITRNMIDIVYHGLSDPLSYVPIDYQQYYTEVINDAPIYENGSLPVCMNMVCQCLSINRITLNDIIPYYKQIKDSDQFIEAVCKNNDLIYEKKKYNFEESIRCLDKGDIILLKIPHSSKYSTTSSYMLLVGYENKNYIVRDPNLYNIEDFATFSKYNQPMYDMESIVISASSNSYMYIFKNNTYENN